MRRKIDNTIKNEEIECWKCHGIGYYYNNEEGQYVRCYLCEGTGKLRKEIKKPEK